MAENNIVKETETGSLTSKNEVVTKVGPGRVNQALFVNNIVTECEGKASDVSDVPYSNSVVAGKNNEFRNVNVSMSIVAGFQNVISAEPPPEGQTNKTFLNAVVCGMNNKVTAPSQGTQIGGNNNVVKGGYFSVIAGENNRTNAKSSVVAGHNNEVSGIVEPQDCVMFGNGNRIALTGASSNNSKAVFVGGVNATAQEGVTFVWNSDDTEGRCSPYSDHGHGTFNVNPQGGVSGFYIGESSFVSCVVDACEKVAELEADDPLRTRFKSALQNLLEV